MKARRRRAAGPSRDPMERFHDEWIGLVQPIDGLVVSKPALIDAQVGRPDDATLRDRFLAHVAGDRIVDLRAFLADLLGLGPDRWIEGDALPDRFRLAVPDTGQLLAPTRALVRDAAADPIALLWELPDALPLDERETVTGGWDYPPSAKLDRLLRHAGVAIGLLSNGTHLRLLYAPHGASTGALTFPVAFMATSSGKPVLDAFVMLLHATRWFGVAPDRQLPALLAASREAQGRVTRELVDQVLEALHLLLAGFEHAHDADGDSALAAAYRDPELGADHVYAGLLTCMLRLVFVLYAEDNGLLPVEDDLYSEHLSALALYEDLAADAGMYPDAMTRRFGAYGRLLSLFRAIYFGVSHGALQMPPRHGDLFSPHVYRFLEGNREPSAPAPHDAEGRRRLDVPAIDDDTVYRVLRRLLVLGEERLSYKALDVEQIGSVYENLMGYRVVQLTAESVCLKKSRAWISGEDLAAEAQGARGKWLQDEAGLPKADADRAAKATAGHKKAAAILDALLESGVALADSRTPAGRFVIQPGPERRRSGSHYTPRSLTAPIVEKTLAPLLAALPRKKGAEGPTSEDLLSLKVCDPAMGSGAFLVEAVRQLGDHVVAAWRREGQAGPLLPSHGPAHGVEDAVAQARRLVAQRCIYGVDKNPQAVTLAKLSLWLVTLARDKPFSFLDHSLRCGDSLVGLDIDQITAFHWDAGKKGQQLDLIDREIRDVLTEAVHARERIVALARDDSPAAQREKERLLRDAQDAVDRLRLIGDLVLGAFFSSTRDKEREAERVRRRDLVERWLASGRPAPAELVDLAAEFRARTPAFHWMIEYPEVFWAERRDPLSGGKVDGKAWIDAFVGNPPFAGKNSITLTDGAVYLDWLMAVRPDVVGKPNTDLCAYFFRRAYELLGSHGTFGLIATNTISQGDSRLVGVKFIVDDGAQIYSARPSHRWPGEAAVMVASLHIAKGMVVHRLRDIPCELDHVAVRSINSRLQAGVEREEPKTLAANADRCFVGGKLVGAGLAVDAAEHDALVALDPRNAQILRPYLGGEEANNLPIDMCDRYAIDFGSLTLEEARAWPHLMKIVEERVRPARERDNRGTYKRYWWRPGESGGALYNAIGSADCCYVVSRHTKHLAVSKRTPRTFFSEALVVFAFGDAGRFGVIQSRVHEAWARLLSSTMKDHLRYSTSDCFETFPFPKTTSTVQTAASRLELVRSYYAATTWQGLTTVYNQLKDPHYVGDLLPSSSKRSATYNHGEPPWFPHEALQLSVPAVQTDAKCESAETRAALVRYLRDLHEDLDRAVLAAYGWSDVPVPPYCPTSDAERAAVAAFEEIIIDRLFALNAERAAEESGGAAPQPAKPAKKPRKKAAKKSPAQGSLIQEEPGEST